LAAKIPDEMMRRMFLENVPWHRAIAAAWAEAHGDATRDRSAQNIEYQRIAKPGASELRI
jgi:hypothetical protein